MSTLKDLLSFIRVYLHYYYATERLTSEERTRNEGMWKAQQAAFDPTSKQLRFLRIEWMRIRNHIKKNVPGLYTEDARRLFIQLLFAGTFFGFTETDQSDLDYRCNMEYALEYANMHNVGITEVLGVVALMRDLVKRFPKK